jgi:hypothetical protein
MELQKLELRTKHWHSNLRYFKYIYRGLLNKMYPKHKDLPTIETWNEDEEKWRSKSPEAIKTVKVYLIKEVDVTGIWR